MIVDEAIKQAKELLAEIEDNTPYYKTTNKTSKLVTIYNKSGRLLGSNLPIKLFREYTLIEKTDFTKLEPILDKYRRLEQLKIQIAKSLDLKVYKSKSMPKASRKKVESLINSK